MGRLQTITFTAHNCCCSLRNGLTADLGLAEASPKGTKWASTFAKAEARELVRQWPSMRRKEEARELVRRYVMEHLGQYLDAMSDNITGIRHLMMRDPKAGLAATWSRSETELYSRKARPWPLSSE